MAQPPPYSITLESDLRTELFTGYSILQRPSKSVEVFVKFVLLTVNDLVSICTCSLPGTYILKYWVRILLIVLICKYAARCLYICFKCIVSCFYLCCVRQSKRLLSKRKLLECKKLNLMLPPLLVSPFECASRGYSVCYTSRQF